MVAALAAGDQMVAALAPTEAGFEELAPAALKLPLADHWLAFSAALAQMDGRTLDNAVRVPTGAIAAAAGKAVDADAHGTLANAAESSPLARARAGVAAVPGALGNAEGVTKAMTMSCDSSKACCETSQSGNPAAHKPTPPIACNWTLAMRLRRCGDIIHP